MKVILNVDVKYLGEEGDIKTVAKGYARNYLFPRNLAVPYNEFTAAQFESRRGEIEERKAAKRQDAAGLKERLEALQIKIVMPAGPNGKLYGAVTPQTMVDELQKCGFDIERKRIELPSSTVKSVGSYKAVIKLYESTTAEVSFEIESQIAEVKTPEKPEKKSRRYNKRDEASGTETEETAGSASEKQETSAAENE